MQINRKLLHRQLYLSGMDENAAALARTCSLGFEITTFCEAAAFDRPESWNAIESELHGLPRRRFHAPFAELAPCAIDPLVRDVAMRRFRQSLDAAARLGADLLIIHDGFIPFVYFPAWFVPQSVKFWQEFLPHVPERTRIALENVMDPDPEMMIEIVKQVNDPRLGLCLDIGHANTCISHKPPLEWIAPMAPYLFHAHLHNNDGSMDLHQPLGEGTIPMEDVLDTLLTLCPDATLTLENMNCTDSLRWLCSKNYLGDDIDL